jgi:hypothetical protein
VRLGRQRCDAIAVRFEGFPAIGSQAMQQQLRVENLPRPGDLQFDEIRSARPGVPESNERVISRLRHREHLVGGGLLCRRERFPRHRALELILPACQSRFVRAPHLVRNADCGERQQNSN